jgi:hypothetical protein
MTTAETTAVTVARAAVILTGFPFTILAAFTAIYSKTPVLRVIPTIIIIPINRPMVFQSI